MTRYGLYYLISSVLSYLSYSFLLATGLPQKRDGATQTPDDLSTGIHQYLVDYCYISVFVWVATALLSRSFWMTYWVVSLSSASFHMATFLILIFSMCRFHYMLFTRLFNLRDGFSSHESRDTYIVWIFGLGEKY